MKLAILITVAVVVVIAVVFAVSSLFIVDQTDQAVLLRFGEIRKVITEPGLYFRTPFIDNVHRFEKRIMIYDIAVEKIITADKKTLLIDTYVLWKIYDAKKFIESIKNMDLALTRIDDVVYSHVRDIFAKHTLEEIVSEERNEFLRTVTELSRNSLYDFGIDVVEVRVKHADLPKENAQAVYNRMKEERYSIAAQIRAEGQKESEKIKAEADKTVTVTLATAESQAQTLRGTGEASATAIYSAAYSRDPEFYELWKILAVYRSSLADSTLILGENSDLLRYFQQIK